MSRAKDFLRRLSPEFPGEGREHNFGWAIATASQFVIEDNAAEDGIDTHNEAFWNEVNTAVSQLERNILRVLGRIGFSVRDEGHGDDDLVGSGWVKEGGSAWHFYKQWREMDEGERLSLDDLGRLYRGAYAELVHNVRPEMVRLLDPTFELLREREE
jgi:hypothetical protein